MLVPLSRTPTEVLLDTYRNVGNMPSLSLTKIGVQDNTGWEGSEQ